MTEQPSKRAPNDPASFLPIQLTSSQTWTMDRSGMFDYAPVTGPKATLTLRVAHGSDWLFQEMGTQTGTGGADLGGFKLIGANAADTGLRAGANGQVVVTAGADAPDSFADTLKDTEALGEPDWRAMTRDGAIFIATVGGQAAGVVAGVPRASPRECGLGAMWVAPASRGRGIAPMLAAAVLAWARAQDCTHVGLWVPADNPRARAFYERQGFRPTGRSRPFPGAARRSLTEMRLALAP